MGGSAGIGAAHGIQALLGAFDRSAAALTNATTRLTGDGANPATDTADLIDGMVGMHLAVAGVKANIEVFRTADVMLGSLLDMKA